MYALTVPYYIIRYALTRHSNISPRVGFCVAPFRLDGQCEGLWIVGRATGTVTHAFFVYCRMLNTMPIVCHGWLADCIMMETFF